MGSIYFYFYKETLLYIGSTFDMKERLRGHKHEYKTEVQPFHKYLKANGLTLDDLELEEVKTGITDKEELRLLEGNCQKLYKSQCNVRIESRTKKEHREDTKDAYNERSRRWRQKETSKIYHREYLKKYKENNRNDINRKQRERNNNNKEDFNRKQREYRAKKNKENGREDINRKQREYRAKKKLEKLSEIQEEH